VTRLGTLNNLIWGEIALQTKAQFDWGKRHRKRFRKPDGEKKKRAYEAERWPDDLSESNVLIITEGEWGTIGNGWFKGVLGSQEGRDSTT